MLTVILTVTSEKNNINYYKEAVGDNATLHIITAPNQTHNTESPTITEQINKIIKASNIGSDILLLSEQIAMHENFDTLLKNMQKALYFTEKHAIVYAQEIENKDSLIKTAKQYLPTYSITMKSNEHCALIKRSVINQLGLFSTKYSTLRYALTDFHYSINQKGFSSITAHHALYTLNKQNKENACYINDKYLFSSTYPYAIQNDEDQTQDGTNIIKFLPVLDNEYYQKKRILFDCTTIPPKQCDKSKYHLSLLNTFFKAYEKTYDIHILTTQNACKYHKLAENYKNIQYPETLHGVFHLGLATDQILTLSQQSTLNKHCLKIVQTVPDIKTIRIDEHLTELANEGGISTLTSGIEISDGIIFMNDNAKNDFKARFINITIPDEANLKVIDLASAHNDTDTLQENALTEYSSFITQVMTTLPVLDKLKRRFHSVNLIDSMLLQIAKRDKEISKIDTQVTQRNEQIAQKDAIIYDRELNVIKMEAQYQAFENAFWWRITKPGRAASHKIKWMAKNFPLTRTIFKKLYSQRHNNTNADSTKPKDPAIFELTQSEREAQETHIFNKNIKISIITPLYNTPEKFLFDMINSVKTQTYANWELCLADGSEDDHAYVGEICTRLAKADERIKYKKLEHNGGISYNTNMAIELATGNYFAMLDHDDILHPSALFEVMNVICNQGADFIYTDEIKFTDTPKNAFQPHFKQDYAPDTLRANNYICHLSVYSRALFEQAGPYHSDFDGSQDYDMTLRLTEKARNIIHIPKLLYYWRSHSQSVAESIETKPQAITSANAAISNHLKRVGLKGIVENTPLQSWYRIRYEIIGAPLVSIIIPNKDHTDDLRKCISSILNLTTYTNYEIIIVENNSETKDIFDYYDTLKSYPQIKIIHYNGTFNYSAINNFAVKHSKAEHLLFLNNDCEVITAPWIEELLMFSQRPDIGATGGKLYYSDDTVQHAGVSIGLLTLAGHLHRGFPRVHAGYMGRLQYAHNLSAVTGACMMVRRDVFNQVNGFDEKIAVAFNDVDFCMRIRKAGYLIVFTPFAELYHYESKSRGYDDKAEKRARLITEIILFRQRWADELQKGDPYYNPNLTPEREDFSPNYQPE